MNQPSTPTTTFNKAQERAIDLLITYQLPEEEVLDKLVQEEGLSRDQAELMILKINSSKSTKNYKEANKDILWGSIWFIGGLTLTIAKTGYIFWGAIIIGGFQLARGVFNRIS
jgi:hypothetical protein